MDDVCSPTNRCISFDPLDLFFQLEREYILQTPSGSDAENHVVKPDARRIGKDIDEDMPSRYQLIHLSDEWYMSASGKRSSKNQPKRKHRKTHGKIGFLELSSVISKRWHNLQELDAETKSYVAKVASRLLEEYKREMAAFKAQNMTNMSSPTLFPVMATSSFDPNMSYLAQPSGEFHYPVTNYASLPALLTTASEAKKLSASPLSVDFDQLLQQKPVSFRTEHRTEAQEKPVSCRTEHLTEAGGLEPLSGFTFHPVSSNDYMKRKSTKSDRHSKRRRHSRRPSKALMKIEMEKAKLKRKIRALQHQIMKQQRNTPSPKVYDRYRAPCPITPAAEESGNKMRPVDSEELMKALEGSDLFA